MAMSKKSRETIEDTLSMQVPKGQVGLGVDIVEISRMREILKRTPSFSKRIFTVEEQSYCNGKADSAIHYATRFAAKEAVVKALGTGFTCGIGCCDIEVCRSKNGRPAIRLSGRAKEVADEQGVIDLPISLSYTHKDAIACAIAITKGSLEATSKRIDPTEELTRQFKEAREMLDDIPAKKDAEGKMQDQV